MNAPNQPALFDDFPEPIQPRTAIDFAARAREKLSDWVRRLQVGDAPGPSAQDLRAWEAIVPNMVRWLPEDEAARAVEQFGLAMQDFRCRNSGHAESA